MLKVYLRCTLPCTIVVMASIGGREMISIQIVQNYTHINNIYDIFMILVVPIKHKFGPIISMVQVSGGLSICGVLVGF